MSHKVAFPASKAAVPVAFGVMTVGEKGREQVRISDMGLFQDILDELKQHGVQELDSARFYGLGSSEESLAKVQAEKQGFHIATKNFPTATRPLQAGQPPYDHSPEGIQKSLDDSLKALQTDKVDLYYLHAPDRTNDFALTMKALDEQYRRGRFARLGISNYRADEVEEIMRICTENDYVKPTVYQGLFNVIVRTAEEPLVPVLRKHNIAYYTYNPLLGGLVSGKVKAERKAQAEEQHDPNAALEKGSRFDKSTWQGQAYRKRYFHDAVFDALDILEKSASENGLTMNEVALRWCMHHSTLSKQYNDHVIFSASSVDHVRQNLLDCEKGPLPESVVKAADQAWSVLKESGEAPSYHF